MKKVYLLAAVLAATLALTALSETTSEPFSWALVYKGQVCNMVPIMTYPTAGTLSSGGVCIYGTVEGTVTEWFASKDMALDRVNGRNALYYGTFPAGYSFGKIPADKLIGLYHTQRIELHQVQVGTHKESVQRTDEIDVPTMEWRP